MRTYVEREGVVGVEVAYVRGACNAFHLAANFRRPWLEACGMGGAVLWRARVPARRPIPELPSLETCRAGDRLPRQSRGQGCRKAAPGLLPMCLNPTTRNWADSILRTDADTQAMPICTLTIGMDSLDGVIHERHPRAGRGSTIPPGAHSVDRVQNEKRAANSQGERRRSAKCSQLPHCDVHRSCNRRCLLRAPQTAR